MRRPTTIRRASVGRRSWKLVKRARHRHSLSFPRKSPNWPAWPLTNDVIDPSSALRSHITMEEAGTGTENAGRPARVFALKKAEIGRGLYAKCRRQRQLATPRSIKTLPLFPARARLHPCPSSPSCPTSDGRAAFASARQVGQPQPMGASYAQNGNIQDAQHTTRLESVNPRVEKAGQTPGGGGSRILPAGGAVLRPESLTYWTGAVGVAGCAG